MAGRKGFQNLKGFYSRRTIYKKNTMFRTFTVICLDQRHNKRSSGGSKLTKLCLTNETDSRTCVISLWITLSSIVARNGKYSFGVLMLNFTECFYTFPLTYTSLPLSLFLNLKRFPRGIFFLNQLQKGF